MPRVSVNECAYLDPRLTAASKLLRLNRERLGWRLIALWSHVTRSGTARVRPLVIASALGKDVSEVADALVESELAEPTDDEALDLEPMRSLFGDYEWYNEIDPKLGGKARADTATRDDSGRFESRDYHSDIVARLEQGPCNRSQLRVALGARNGKVRAAVRDLLADGTIVERAGKLLALVTSSDACVPPVPCIVPAELRTVPAELRTGNASPVPGTLPFRVPPSSASSAPAPAPVPALAPARESDTRAQAEHSGTRERGNAERGNAVHGTRPGPVILSSTKPPPPSERREIARALWRYQNKLRSQVSPTAPTLPNADFPGGPLDPVERALAGYSPAQCKHALDVYAIEAECLRAQGDDPLKFLNGSTNWKPEQLVRAIVGTPDGIRKRYAREARANAGRNPAEPNKKLKRLGKPNAQKTP